VIFGLFVLESFQDFWNFQNVVDGHDFYNRIFIIKFLKQMKCVLE